MQLTRNHYFLAGIVILMLGIQFRAVESFVINERCAQLLEKRLGKPQTAAAGSVRLFMPAARPTPMRTVQPPDWLGWCLLSIGGVLILHSFALKKPEGG